MDVDQAREVVAAADHVAAIERFARDGGCPITINVWLSPGRHLELKGLLYPDFTWEWTS